MAPKSISNSHAPKQVTEFSELRTAIFPMLYTIGSYLSYDPELVYKVIRLLKLGLIEVRSITWLPLLYTLEYALMFTIFIAGWRDRTRSTSVGRFVVFRDINCPRFDHSANFIGDAVQLLRGRWNMGRAETIPLQLPVSDSRYPVGAHFHAIFTLSLPPICSGIRCMRAGRTRPRTNTP